jgi:hypothetical protein
LTIREWLDAEIAVTNKALENAPGPHLHYLLDVLKITNELLIAHEKIGAENAHTAWALFQVRKILRRLGK